MKRSITRSAWFRLGLGSVVVLLLAVLSAGWWLPPLAEALLQRELAKRGFVNPTVHVAAVSFWRAELGPLVLGEEPDALRIETVRLTYSLRELFDGRAKSIELVGVTATVRQLGATWSMAGLEPLGVEYPAAAESAKPGRRTLDLPFAELSIRSSTLRITTPSGTVRIAVPRLECDNWGDGRFQFNAVLEPEGQEVSVEGSLNMVEGPGYVSWFMPNFDLAVCAETVAKLPVPARTLADFRVVGKAGSVGQVGFAGGVIVSLTATLSSSEVSVASTDGEVRLGSCGISVTAPKGLGSLSASLYATVQRARYGTVCLGSDAQPVGDVYVTLSEVAPTANAAAGTFGLDVNPAMLSRLLPGATFTFEKRRPRLSGLWHVKRQTGQPLAADLDLSADEEMSVTSLSPPAKLAGRGHVDVSASLDGDGLAASAVVRVEHLAGEIAGATVAASELGLWAALPPTGVSDAESGLAAVLESGLQGGFVLTGGSFRHAAYGSCDELNVFLPLSWSPADGLRTPQGPDGTLPIQWRGLMVQDVLLKDGAAGLSVTDSGARLEVRLALANGALAANLVAQASWAEVPTATVNIEVPPVALTEKEPLLAARLKAFPGATCAAELGGHILLQAEAGAPLQANGQIVVDKGEFAYPAKKLSVKGIAGSVDFASLLPLRTPPAQRLVFSAAEVGGLPVDGGTIVFQVESPASVFIEKGDISWAGGWLRGYAFRFNPARPEGSVVLYADAIDLSRFLSSFKNFKGQGSGILYGRLPFRVHNGVVRFADGFLISVPGQPGHLKLTEQDWLVTALDQTQMDAAMLVRVKKALTDFDFSVFRMDLDTGDAREAVLRVRVAGKGRQDPDLPPLDLEVNVRGPLDYLFNLGLRLAK